MIQRLHIKTSSTEISNFELVVLSDQQVLGLQVSVQNGRIPSVQRLLLRVSNVLQSRRRRGERKERGEGRGGEGRGRGE